MSVPPGAALAFTSASIEALNPIEAIINGFNTNPYFIGIMMLFLNLGGRFLAMDVSKEQEKFFSNPWIRSFLFFVVIFIATRNILVAFWLSIVVVFIVKFLFNENSVLYLFSKEDMKDYAREPAPVLTAEEMDIYKKLSDKVARSQAAATKEPEDKNVVNTEMVYLANMSRLKV